MDLQHTFTVPIGIDAAWVAFNDLEGIAPCFPGAVITSVDGDDFTGTAKVKLGPVALMYSGKGQWLSRDKAAHRAVIDATGKDKRGNGTASATITAHLESQSPAMTTVVVNTDLRITGRPAQFGRGVIQDVGSKILDQFAACLSARLGQGDSPDGNPRVDDTGGGESAGKASDAGVDVPEVGATEPGADPTAASAPAVTVTPAATGPSAGGPANGPAATVEPMELDLRGLVGPVLVKRFGPTVAACLLTAVVTWMVARRRS